MYTRSVRAVLCVFLEQGHKERPLVKSIKVGGEFECVGMDFKDMDKSIAGNI